MHGKFLKPASRNRFTALGLGTLILAAACTASVSEENKDVEVQQETVKIFDPELLALLPENVPGSELGWLSGRWVKSSEGCAGSTYMQASVSRSDLYLVTSPEPAKAESGVPVQGRARINPGERGFTYVTPPTWKDAYLRVKETGEGYVEVEFVEFAPAETRWNVTDTFSLKRCD